MQVEMWEISKIKAYEKNPRDNSKAVDAVAESIRQFGFKVPVIVDKDGVLIAGHTRLLAAQKLGMDKLPVVRADDLTPEQVKAFRIADNKLHELSDWNYELLPIELKELAGMDFDMGMLGFDEEELGRLLSGDVNDGLTDPDDVPAPPDEPVTQPGDIWILGNHRLMCGDSGSVEDLDRLLDGEPVHLVNTDPPYGVKVEPRSNNAIAAGLSSFGSGIQHHQSFDMARDKTKAQKTTEKLRPKDRPLANDFLSDEEFEKMLKAWFNNIGRVLLPGHIGYVWGGYANLGNYPKPLKEAGLYFSQAVIWDKQHPVLTRKDFMGAFEICFYTWKEGAAHRYFGPNNATDLWHVKKVNPQNMIHLTEKPVELAVRAIQYSSLQNENVLDLFGGSGSTLIACEQTGRKAFLMEIDGAYCDVIRERWEKFTGKKAELIRASKNTPAKAGAKKVEQK